MHIVLAYVGRVKGLLRRNLELDRRFSLEVDKLLLPLSRKEKKGKQKVQLLQFMDLKHSFFVPCEIGGATSIIAIGSRSFAGG